MHIEILKEGGVTAPKGFRANGIHCGIRKNKDKKDLMLIVSDVLCDAAAVYTQNLVCGAPVTVTRENLKNGKARAVICNSGIANTCNADGEEKAQAIEDYKEKVSNPYRAAEQGYIDEIILPKDTRFKLIQALEMTQNKSQSNPPKKHGNMPL